MFVTTFTVVYAVGHRSKEQLFVKYSRKISYNKSISCPLSSIVL